MSARNGIGANIAETRKLRGMTQHELARSASVSFSLLSKVEAGHRPASPVLVAAGARALQTLQGHNQTGNQEQAPRNLIEAEEIASREVRCRTTAQATIGDLMRRSQSAPSPALEQLAARAGLRT